MKKIISLCLVLMMLITSVPTTIFAANDTISLEYSTEITMTAAGKEQELLPASGETATFSTTVLNVGEGNASTGMELIVAAYKEDGSVADTFRQPVTFTGKKGAASIDVTVKDSYYTAKAFVWDTLFNVAPLAEAYLVNSEDALNSITIEVQNSAGAVLASNAKTGGDTLIYNGTYKYESDVIVFKAPEGVQHMMIQVDEYVGTPTVIGEEVKGAATEVAAKVNLDYTYEPSLVYAPNGEVRFTVPTPSSETDKSNFSPYDSRAFKGTTHVITARAATQEEIYARRNVALNPFDNMETLPYDQHYNRYSFPHAITNFVTRDEERFVPRNAIDGFELNNWHENFPYQSWAGGDRDDLNYSVLFGRNVVIDEVQILLRAQWGDNHDTYWTSAVLEFSDGTEMEIDLELTNEMQSFKLPEPKKTSWVHLKELKRDRSTLTSPYAALTEIKVFGADTKEADTLPSAETLVKLVEKVNDYWINLNGSNLGSYVWNNAVYHTGNMEAYYLTGDENYYNNAVEWAKTWNWAYPNYTKLDNSNAFHADNEIIYQTCIDLYNIDPQDERIKIAKQVIDNQIKANGSDSHWWWIDALYMAMPVYTKLGVLTGDTTYFDQMYDMYIYAKETRKLYNTEEHLWYRDEKYIPGNANGTSANGKKVYWSRGDGWVFAALAKVLQDLPDSDPHRAEYEKTFVEMAEALLAIQGSDGYWRRNLGDYDELPQPETSGTVFFTYGFAWGINHGYLDRDTYLPAIIKTVNALNATGIHPTGRVGRLQPIGENPAPTQNIGYAVTQDFGVGGTLLMLSEVSKLEGGLYSDDLMPMLEKRMVNAVGVKVDSPYALVGNTYGGDGCKVEALVTANKALTPIEKDGKVYVPTSFVTEKYGKTLSVTDKITQSGVTYLELTAVAKALGKELFVINDVIVIGNQEKLFLTDMEEKLILLLNEVLTNGALPNSPVSENRFDFLKMDTPENMVKITSVEATAEPESENPKENVIDRKLTTRWSANSGTNRTGQSVTVHFDPVEIEKVGVALYNNTTRTTTYQVEVQLTNGTWKTVRSKAASSGITNSFEYVQFDPVEAKAVRVTGYGNTQNEWTSITEVEVLKASNDTAKANSLVNVASARLAAVEDSTAVNANIETGYVTVTYPADMFSDEEASIVCYNEQWNSDPRDLAANLEHAVYVDQKELSSSRGTFGFKINEDADADASYYLAIGTTGRADVEVIEFTFGKEEPVAKEYYSTASWTNYSLGQGNTGKQYMEFDLEVFSAPIDGVVAYSSYASPMTDWATMPISLQIGTNGQFNARNNTAYVNDTALYYEINKTYHVTFIVDIDKQTYSVDIQTEDGKVTRIADNYAFRTEAPALTDIGNLLVRGGSGASANQFMITNHEIYANKPVPTPTPTPTPTPDPFRYDDVKEGDWFWDAVYYCYDEKLMTGMDEDSFGPYSQLSRAQFALILYRMAGTPKVDTDKAFADVTGDEWYGQAVLWAAEAKVVNGYENGCFGPADMITREQMALMMYRYAEYLGLNVDIEADFDTFKDAKSVSVFAEEAMRWAVGNGIITGKDNGTLIDPQGNTARSETAVIIQRFMN